MPLGWIVFGLIVVFMLGGLLAFRSNAKLPFELMLAAHAFTRLDQA